MQKPQIPLNEKQRLKTLYTYDILDTEAEQVFDELTQLASEICDTPIALISLIDSDRQWFKSATGIQAEQTSRDIAFCAHAINQNEVFEVPDALEDERFKDNPLVTNDPNIRFYAGAPLRTPEGLAIGTICAISDKPAKLNKHQIKSMQILSREVVSQLELRLKVKQLEKANQRKSEFISSLSHELHTPLHAIVNLSQLMLNNKDVPLPDKYNTYLKHLDVSGRRLISFVNNVLDINNIESGTLAVKEKDLKVNEYFKYIKSAIELSAEKKSIKVDFSITANSYSHIYLDNERLSQIIFNLSDNAIKFSPVFASISINIVLTESTLTLAVKDNGIGMEESDVQLMFDSYQKAGNKHTSEGIGLGLKITKSLVELMGGEIKMFSQVGQGTLVKVTIPLSHQNKVHGKTQVISKQQAKDLKVLVVEDNIINQEIATANFAEIGVTVDIAASGREAVEMALNNSYTLIFMDIHLPDFNGFEASQIITEHKPEQIIVALTADAFAIHDARNATAGIQSVISKPFHCDDLITALNKHVSGEFDIAS